MPESTEFRVGDKVETRRGTNVREEFRQKRGTITQVVGTAYRIEFANPPTSIWSDGPDHGGLWSADQLRLVERALVIGEGAEVFIADGACTHANGRSPINRDFTGTTGTVLHPYTGGSSMGQGIWYVRVRSRNIYIHESYLTVLTEAVPSKFKRGDRVALADPAYGTDHASITNRLPSSICGTVGTIRARAAYGTVGVWEVDTWDGGIWAIHENWMEKYEDTEEPRFVIGDHVTIATTPYQWAGERGRVSSLGVGVLGVVTGGNGTTMNLDTLDGSGWRVHQSHLEAAEVPVPGINTHVRVHRDTPGVSNLRGRVGQVVRIREDRRLVVQMPSGHSGSVYAMFTEPVSEEEAATAIMSGVNVRVALSERVDIHLVGRVMRVTDDSGGVGEWYLVDDYTGHAGWLNERYLSRISTVESDYTCRQCGTGVPENQVLEHRGSNYCPECLIPCVHCETHYNVNTTASLQWHSERGWECSLCVVQCPGCRHRYLRDDMHTDSNGSQWCGGCVGECHGADCDETVYGSDRFCAECRNSTGYGSLGRWRRTNPTMWLGGPVRRKGGYYIGFEHEVTAEGAYPMKPLRRWALENLGSKQALDPKPDSTVNGFEIATMPMTPAFFESVDWDSYMAMLDEVYSVSKEPTGHGIHVHIGRQAFRREKVLKTRGGRALKVPIQSMVTDTVMLAAFTYLLSSNHDQMTRIGRRNNTEWAEPILKPVSATALHDFAENVAYTQQQKIRSKGGVYIPRGAVNLTNERTIEIRVFRSTRDADDLRAAVRVVYLAAEYVRWLRQQGGLGPAVLTWDAFAEWVRHNMPDAYQSIKGEALPESSTPVVAMTDIMAAFEPTAEPCGGPNLVMEEPVDPDLVTVAATTQSEWDDDEYDDEEENDPF